MKRSKTFNYVPDEMRKDCKPQLVKGRTGWVVKGLVYASLVGVGLMGINMTDTQAAEWTPNTSESIRAKIKEGDTSYTFAEGDTFYEIGRAINVKYTVLMELNGFEEGSQYTVPVGTTITFDGRKVTLMDKNGKVVNEKILSDDAKVDKSQPFMNQKSDTIKGTSAKSGQSTVANNGGNSNKPEPVQPVTPIKPVKPTDPTTPVKPVDPKPEDNRLAELKKQLAELEAQLTIKQAELEDAFARLNEANAKIKENSTILVNAQISVNNLNEELAVADAAIVTAQTKTYEAQTAIDAWQPTEIETEMPALLKENLTNAQAELATAQAGKEATLAKKEAADQALEAAKQLPEIDAVSIAEETSRINDEIQILQQKIDEVKAEIAKIEGNTKPTEDNKLEEARQTALNTLGTLNLLPEELSNFIEAIKLAKSNEEITDYLAQAQLAHNKNEAIDNESKELKEAKVKAITQLEELNLGSEDKEILTYQINTATTIGEIDEVLVHGKSISAENNQKEEAEKLKVDTAKSEAKKELASFNLTEEEQATFISLVDNAKTVSEVSDALENARQVSDHNDQNSLEKAKKEAISSLESLNLKAAEKEEFTLQIQEAQSLSDINSVLKEVETVSNKNDEAVNEKELTEVKNQAKQDLSKMNLTESQKIAFEKQIDEATTVSSINLIVINAQKVSDKNNEESENAEKLIQAKEQAKKEINALEYLPQAQKETTNQSIDNAKSIAEINDILTSSKEIDEQFKHDAESAKKLEETRQGVLTELASLNLKGNTSYEASIKKATTETEINAILSAAKDESAKNNQEETEAKELEKAKNEAKVELASLNLTEKQRTQYTSQIELSENMAALNEVIVAARATSKENDEKPAEKQKAFVEVKVLNTKFQVIDTITVEVELDENNKFEVDFNDLGLTGYEFVSGYLTGTAQPGQTVKTTIRVQAIAIDLNSPEAIAAMQEAFIKRINEERASEGIAPLEVLTDYNYIGEIRATEILEKFEHDRPDGSNYLTVFGDNGFGVSGGNGEVIFQVNSKGMTTEEIGTFAAQAFLNSPGHRLILMNPKYNYLVLGFHTEGNKTGVVGITTVNEPKPL